MYKNFVITESEKEQILNRLKENGYKKPMNENHGMSRMQHEIDSVVNNLSDEEVHELQKELANMGITANTPIKHAMNIVKQEESMEMDMNEGMKKQKVASILSSVGTGLLGSTLVPIIPLALGNAMNIGFAGGLAVHLAAAGLLVGLAKALNKKESSTEHGNY